MPGSTLAKSGSAAVLGMNKDRQSNILIGCDPCKWESEAAGRFVAHKSQSAADLKALAEGKKYLRKTSWTMGGNDPFPKSTFADCYAPPPPEKQSGQTGDKTTNNRSNWSLGFENEPGHYESVHQVEICQPALLRPSEEDANRPADTTAARATTILLGTDNPVYKSCSRAAHCDMTGGEVHDPAQCRERSRISRLSNFHFGLGHKDEYGTEGGSQFKYHGDPKWLASQLVAQLPDGKPKKGYQRVNLLMGTDDPTRKSEAQMQFGKADELMEAAKNPCRLDDAMKADLRVQHFYLGTDPAVNASEAADAYCARGLGSSAQQEAERQNLMAIRKDLRATHITLGNDAGVSKERSTCQDAFTNPLGKPVCERVDKVGTKVDHKKVNFTMGVDNEDLKRDRGTSMGHNDMVSGVAAVDYAKLMGMDEETKADLRRSHFYLGKEDYPKRSNAQEAFVHHKGHERYVIPQSQVLELRREHFTFGMGEGMDKCSKSTAQDAQIYHGKDAYTIDRMAVKEKINASRRANWTHGGNDGPRRSVAQDSFKHPSQV